MGRLCEVNGDKTFSWNISIIQYKAALFQKYNGPTDSHNTELNINDLMRLVDGVGCEYGTDWVVKHILETELEPVDLEESFEQSVRECYPETTKVGWCEFDTVTLLKEQDPVSWRCALSEYESQEADEGNVVSFDGVTFYHLHSLENLIDSE